MEIKRITVSGVDGHLDYLDRKECVEIVDIAVGNGVRRQGYGRLLVERLFTELGDGRRVYAVTRASNEVAQQFYTALGFHDVNPLRRFYCDERSGIDAVMYSRWTGGPV